MTLLPSFDHVNLPVSDLQRSGAFYRATLEVFGMLELVSLEEVIGYGRTHWELGIELTSKSIAPSHIALYASSSEIVDSFYDVGKSTGAVCNGMPGYRPEYGEQYYAAYLLDPDGHNLEAVCRRG